MMLFLTLMVVGLAGLTFMALPGLARRGGHGVSGHATSSHGLHVAKGPGHLRVQVPKSGHPGATHAPGAAGTSATGSGLLELASHLIPEPRAVLSLLTLYGASGYVLEGGFHLSHGVALIAAALPALVLELALVGPLWRFALRFQGKEAAPLEWLLAENATAVTAFTNGRGIVRATHDGRVVQLSARLIPAHADQPVRVGDILRIEEIDTGTERVTVSLNTPPLTRSDS